jgi:hypothetical protein
VGHVARLHRELDLAAVMPSLERLREDPKTRGRVENALSDIEGFVHRRRR